MICPCKGCPKKGCGSYHDICPDYQPWAKSEKKKKAKIQAENEIKSLSRDHELKYRKNLKKGGPKK